jgi:monoamine oxidase
MLTQLDAMFGTAAEPRPASSACDGFLVKDWSAHPRTYGAYSHPTLGAAGQRSALGLAAHAPWPCMQVLTPAPWSPHRSALGLAAHGAIFFAGEACHEGINPCVHGAMETGERAAQRALEALGERSAFIGAEGRTSRL